MPCHRQERYQLACEAGIINTYVARTGFQLLNGAFEFEFVELRW
jgi:hypothetical protein